MVVRGQRAVCLNSLLGDESSQNIWLLRERFWGNIWLLRERNMVTSGTEYGYFGNGIWLLRERKTLQHIEIVNESSPITFTNS
jgi:hypothetical protein